MCRLHKLLETVYSFLSLAPAERTSRATRQRPRYAMMMEATAGRSMQKSSSSVAVRLFCCVFAARRAASAKTATHTRARIHTDWTAKTVHFPFRFMRLTGDCSTIVAQHNMMANIHSACARTAHTRARARALLRGASIASAETYFAYTK